MLRILCDCGCRKELGEHDAGTMPVMLRHAGLVIEVRVHSAAGKPVPNLRPSCLREIAGKAEQVFPPTARTVDAGVATEEEDADPLPLRAAGAST